ncbi:unnamed protein product, partial [marine sediment metagenome]
NNGAYTKRKKDNNKVLELNLKLNMNFVLEK